MTNKEKAHLVAEKIHFSQTYDIFPYIYHVKKVVKIAECLGYDEAIVVSCYLHDTLEDGSISYNDIKKYFGEEIAEIVFAVTDELGRNRKERKAKTYPKIRSNWKAVAVKICDRIANVSHSKEFNPDKFRMYTKESKDFYDNIYNPAHPKEELEKAWAELNKLTE